MSRKSPKKRLIERHLKLLGGRWDEHTILTYDDNQDRRDQKLTQVFHGNPLDFLDTLKRLNKKGAGVFITVNKTDGTGRRKGNIKDLRAVWIEDDNDGGITPPILPNFEIESSPGKFHKYFITKDGVLEEFESVQQRLVKNYGSDPCAADRSRVLRLSGFLHQKVNAKKGQDGRPFMVRVVKEKREKPYKWKKLKEKFKPVKKNKKKKGQLQSGPVPKYVVKQIDKALECFDADDRSEWIARLHNLKSLRNQGKKIARRFSKRSTKYDKSDFEERWKGIKQTNTDFRDLLRAAKARGWIDSKKILDGISFNSIAPGDLTEWAKELMPTDEQMSQISAPKFIFANLVIHGHVIAIVAEPNGGKTTIFMYVAGEMVKEGYEVFYVNADTSGGDAKPMYDQAKASGVNLVLPDLVGGGHSMEDVIVNLHGMNQADEDLSKYVFIFDTLKKMTDVINKSRAKELYKLLRSLSSKGMTIIVLAHTNKYKDADGSPIYEGTGDLRSDLDELIYLIPEKQSDGSMVVTTKPDKVRGTFVPMSFKIDSDRKVHVLDRVIDTEAHRIKLSNIKRDQNCIDAIDAAIISGKCTQKKILAYVLNNYSIKNYTATRVLKRYEAAYSKDLRRSNIDGVLWGVCSSGVKNHLKYCILSTEQDMSLAGGFDSV